MKRILLVTAAVLFGMNMSAQNLVSNSMFDTDMTQVGHNIHGMVDPWRLARYRTVFFM